MVDKKIVLPFIFTLLLVIAIFIVLIKFIIPMITNYLIRHKVSLKAMLAISYITKLL